MDAGLRLTVWALTLSVQLFVACSIACVANKHRLPANAQLHFNCVTGADFRDTHR
jgi:hypothetical protein